MLVPSILSIFRCESTFTLPFRPSFSPLAYRSSEHLFIIRMIKIIDFNANESLFFGMKMKIVLISLRSGMHKI